MWRRQCRCGEWMKFQLRTVMYLNKVEIANVPVLSCETCDHSEVFPAVKPELKDMIRMLGGNPRLQRLDFPDFSELAGLISRAMGMPFEHRSVEQLIEERIDWLLDILILAQVLSDPAWVSEVRGKLMQWSKHMVSIH